LQALLNEFCIYTAELGCGYDNAKNKFTEPAVFTIVPVVLTQQYR
jgi:hypothetical protein